MKNSLLKRSALLLIAALLALSLCACGKGAGQDELLGASWRELYDAYWSSDRTAYCGSSCIAAREADGTMFVCIGDGERVSTVARYTEDGRLTKLNNGSFLADVEPARLAGMSEMDVERQYGPPVFNAVEDMFDYYGQRFPVYVTDDARIFFLCEKDGQINGVVVLNIADGAYQYVPDRQIRLEEAQGVTLTWEYDEIPLTDEEALQVIRMFNGKERSFLTDVPLCGFYQSFSLRIGKRRFCPACDGDPIVMDYDTGLFFDLTQEERDALNAIIDAHMPGFREEPFGPSETSARLP